jgi:hypothetical protein
MSETSKYEEAAEKYAFRVPYDGTDNFYNDDRYKAFLAGAEHASKSLQQFKLAIEIKKEAHNEAIDKAIKVITDTWGGKCPIVKVTEELEKLKL